MKVFMDHSDQYPELKIIALGAVNTARQVVMYDVEMRRRVAEIKVPLMTEDEIHKIIKQGCKLLNITVTDSVLTDIWSQSNGVASICHQLCLLMCEFEGLDETIPQLYDGEFDVILDSAHLQFAFKEYLEIESDTIKYAFDLAFQVESGDDVILILSEKETSGDTLANIHHDAKKKELRISEKNIESILQHLSKPEHGELIKFDEDSQKYSFSDPFYKTYAQVFMQNKPDDYNKRRRSDSEMKKIINNAFDIIASDAKPISTYNKSASGKVVIKTESTNVGSTDHDIDIVEQELRRLDAKQKA